MQAYLDNLIKNKEQLIQEFTKLSDYYGIDQYDVENKEWSRFSDIYGAKDSQIILKNGNPINGNLIFNRYIATQQPISVFEAATHTINDFWQMVWDYDVNYIVNLNDKDHNTNYFLSDQFEVNNLMVSIILINSESDTGIYFRLITIKNNIDNQTKTCTHIFYPKWKDHSVPPNIKEFSELIKYVIKIRRSGEKMLIHCRAGVGRTGTYILIDYIISELLEGNKLNIIETIKNMRMQRCTMIQTKAQFEFGITVIENLLQEFLINANPDHLLQ